ncbi:hypothetical protein BHE74_00044184 [Ensete ventricosum]|nr:hypothetical protein BHE74_00044184 [Ensete ventricosum]
MEIVRGKSEDGAFRPDTGRVAPRPGGGAGRRGPDGRGVQEGHGQAQEAGVQPSLPPAEGVEARPLQQEDRHRRRRRGGGRRKGLHHMLGGVRAERPSPGDAMQPHVPQRLLGAMGEEPGEVPGVQVCALPEEGGRTGPKKRRGRQ